MSMSPSNDGRNGILLILASVTGYSMLPIFLKAIQNAGLGALDIATWRFAIATPLIWLIVHSFRLPQGEKTLPRLKLLGMGSILAAAAVVTFLGFERIPAGTYTVLFYTYPAVVAVLSAFTGERLPLRGWLALMLTTIGIVLTVPDFAQGIGNNNLIGVLLALLCALLVAIYFLLSARVLKGHTALATASAWTTSGALLALLVLIPFRSLQPSGDFLDHMGKIAFSFPLLAMAEKNGVELWLRMLAIATISTVFAGFFLTVGIQKIGAARASIIGTAEPILTLIFARIFLGEQMQPVQLIGGMLIVTSMIVLQLGNRLELYGENSQS